MNKQDIRGQNSIDLLIAVSLFFAGIAIIFANSAGLFFPTMGMVDETTELQSITDRVEDQVLGSADSNTISHTDLNRLFAELDNNSKPPQTVIGNKAGTKHDIYIEISATSPTITGDNETRAFKPELYNTPTTPELNNQEIIITPDITKPNEPPNPENVTTTTITRYSYLGGQEVELKITIAEAIE